MQGHQGLKQQRFPSKHTITRSITFERFFFNELRTAQHPVGNVEVVSHHSGESIVQNNVPFSGFHLARKESFFTEPAGKIRIEMQFLQESKINSEN
jgi:hypothetical protein